MVGKFNLSALSDFLEKQRKLRQLSKEKFADFLGIGKSTYYRMTSETESQSRLDPETIDAIADALHIERTTVYGLTNPDPEVHRAAAAAAESEAEEYLFLQLVKRVPKSKRSLLEGFIDLLIRDESEERGD